MQNNKIFNDNNDSIATVLKKIKLKNNLYQFVYDKSVIGHFDNDKRVFVSISGDEYYNINDSKHIDSNDVRYFGTCLEKKDLELVFSFDDNESDKYLITKFIEYAKTIMYLVKVRKNNNDKKNLFIKEVNLNKVENTFNAFDNNVVGDFNYFLEVFLDDERSDKFLDNDIVDYSNVTYELSKLIKDIYNCEFNSSELFTIARNISDIKDYYQSVLDTIELQLQAYHNQDQVPLHPDDSDFDFVNSDFDSYTYFSEKKYNDKKEEKVIEQHDVFKKKLDLIELRDEIKKYLINQDEALRRVLVEIARMDVKENEKNKGILLLGESGTGKTYLMELLANNLGVPFLIIDSTQLTIPGYVGKDIQEYLWDLYESCDRDLEKAEQAIIFFDEIDKKGSNRKSDSSGQGVLNVLLKFLDGTTYDACRDTKHSTEIVKINTSKMKIIAGGAFNDVFSKGSKKPPVGFKVSQDENDKTEIPDADTFVQKAFMTHEFMGRFPIRIKLNPHNVDSFTTILRESEDSTLKEEERTFNKLGVKLTVTPEFIKVASNEALKLKTGVRGLMGCIEEATWVAFEDAYNNPGKYEEIILTDETFKDPTNYQKVLKK